MSEQAGSGARRLRVLRGPRTNQPAQEHETAASVLPEVPRVAALDALLRDVDGLRLALETDLTMAASALEAGAADVALDILDSDQVGLRAFERRALDHLADLAEPPARRRRVALPAAPFVAAAALVVGFLTGVVPGAVSRATDDVTPTTVSANSTLAQLTELAAAGETAQVRDAADQLHDQIAALVQTAGQDPVAAQRALLLLSAERAVIRQSGDSSALADVLARSVQLSAMLLKALPPQVRATMPATVSHLPAAEASPTARSSASPKPSPTATRKPVTSPAPSTAATPSPSPTASSGGDGYQLPTNPALNP